MSIIEFRKTSKHFGDLKVLDEVDLSIATGEVVVLVITWFLAPSQLWLMVTIMVVVSVILFSLLRNIQKLFKLRQDALDRVNNACLLYTSPSPRD